tara:strand:- start:300 stop:839 length:540 start_codon:yes stop_codon:yes gene_type:complete
MEIPKKLKNEIWEYCRMNDISNIDEFIIKMVRQGYTVEKFGATPVGAGEITEVEKIVEKIIEVPVEKIVEKTIEVPVEKIVEKEVYITDDEQVNELSKKIQKVEKENKVLREKVSELETKPPTIIEKEVTVEKVVKVKDEEEIEKLKKEIEELKKKNNKDIYDDEKKGGWFGSNLLNRK